MKEYIKATVSVVELEPVESIAANPFGITVALDGDGNMVTTYDLSLFSEASYAPGP